MKDSGATFVFFVFCNMVEELLEIVSVWLRNISFSCAFLPYS